MARRRKPTYDPMQPMLDIFGLDDALADARIEQERSAPLTETESELVNGTLSFDEFFEQQLGASHEQVRTTGDGALEQGGTVEGGGAREPGGILHGAGGAGHGTSRGPAATDSGAGRSRGGIFGEGGTAEYGTETGRGDGPQRTGVDYGTRAEQSRGGTDDVAGGHAVTRDRPGRGGPDAGGSGIPGGSRWTDRTALRGLGAGEDRGVQETRPVVGADLESGRNDGNRDRGAPSGDSRLPEVGRRSESALGAGPLAPTRYQLTGDEPPTGERARFAANLAAVKLADLIEAKGRTATTEEQQVLAAWSGWGAVPKVFDERDEGWASEREALREVLDEGEWAAARRTTLNAHYTHPSYATAIWEGLEQLGFTEGTVLEPGSGLGNFIGTAPAGASMIGVELDPTTARISRLLHPAAEIRAESFADTTFAGIRVDAAVGNVPFGDYALTDRVHNPGGHLSIHNHFIVKSLASTRPGGMVAVLTSSYTMDARNAHARRTMHELGDLVGAIRLPSSAHSRTAGTDVVTDLVILRRREAGEVPGDASWTRTVPVSVDGEVFQRNEYFEANPDHVLGEQIVRKGRFGPELTVVPHGGTADVVPIAAALRDRLTRIAADATVKGLTFTEPSTNQLLTAGTAQDSAVAELPEWDGMIVVTDNGSFMARDGEVMVPFEVPKSAGTELAQLVQLRDLAHQQLQMQSVEDEDTPSIVEHREQLAAVYQAHVSKYGPINRVTVTETKRISKETGQPIISRRFPTATRLLRKDPSTAIVFALEEFDEETQVARPAKIVTQRVVAPRPEILGVDTAEDAIAVSLDRHGEVRLTEVADLLGISETEAREEIRGAAFELPDQNGSFETSAAYLSGNVREKLLVAQQAANEDERFRENVVALEAVMPVDLQPDELKPTLGAVWIPAADVQVFLREITKDQRATVANPLPGKWEVSGARHTTDSRVTWGTDRRSAGELLERILNQSQITVMETFADGSKVFDAAATAEAEDKAREIRDRFEEWVWEDAERTERLVRTYNERFNSHVLRDYSREGDRLTFPGLVEGWIPREHQRAAVARMIAEPAAGLFHEVGAGKTAEMVMGLTELKRLGLVRKPAVVIPNHMLEQFSREWLQLYPQARVLAASTDDLAGDKRRQFVARAAANDWDAVILTQTAFERLSLSEANMRAYLDLENERMRTALMAMDTSGSGASRTVKQIEKKIASEEEKLAKKRVENPDPGLRFEETGIDYLAVDELHLYKNLRTASAITEANIGGSDRASDLHAKLHYLRSQYGQRVFTGATATPLANSITEAHVMMRYLRPDLLEDAGVDQFDAWAATFGQMVTEVEVSPAGKYSAKSRLARFQNVPEMLRMFRIPGDIKTAADLNLPTPEIAVNSNGDRAPEIISVPASKNMLAFVEVLQTRIDAVKARSVEPHEDNMLKISSDGRAGALDLRLVGLEPSEDGGKITAAAERIYSLWEQTRDQEYLDPDTGDPYPVRGALQLAFLDLSTPNKDKPWNAYDELKTQLVAKGMPAESIEFMQHYKKDTEKARLFSRARAGHVALLIGSTSNMGVGTNVQARAIALHDLDCPWRPADLHQRQGRILRQGNLNPEIQLYRYVSERSYDGYMYQAVERKAKMIDQMMRGSLDVREVEDISEGALEAGQAKAIISGDPLLLERVTVEREVQQLEQLQRAHRRRGARVEMMIGNETSAVRRLSVEVTQLEAAVPNVQDTSGDKFAMEVGGLALTSRTEAADALRGWALRDAQFINIASERDFGVIGKIGAFEITARTRPHESTTPIVALELKDVPGSDVLWKRSDFGLSGTGIVTRLENQQARIPKNLETSIAKLENANTRLAELRSSDGAVFKHAPALEDAKARLENIVQQMTQQTQARTNEPDKSVPPVVVDLQERLNRRLTGDPKDIVRGTMLQGIESGTVSAENLERMAQHAAAVASNVVPEARPDVQLSVARGTVEAWMQSARRGVSPSEAQAIMQTGQQYMAEARDTIYPHVETTPSRPAADGADHAPAVVTSLSDWRGASL